MPLEVAPAENEETLEEEKPEMEPELDIKVIYTGWDTTTLENALTEMIMPIPSYPMANW